MEFSSAFWYYWTNFDDTPPSRGVVIHRLGDSALQQMAVWRKVGMGEGWGLRLTVTSRNSCCVGDENRTVPEIRAVVTKHVWAGQLQSQVKVDVSQTSCMSLHTCPHCTSLGVAVKVDVLQTSCMSLHTCPHYAWGSLIAKWVSHCTDPAAFL
jgi:hypothetical protein